LAVAQPLFDLLGSHPEFFATHGSRRGAIVAFALALIVVPPLPLLGVEWLAGLVSVALGWAFHLAAVTVLVAALALQVVEHRSPDPRLFVDACSLWQEGSSGSPRPHSPRCVTSQARMTPATTMMNPEPGREALASSADTQAEVRVHDDSSGRGTAEAGPHDGRLHTKSRLTALVESQHSGSRDAAI
jgi:hypothetical protein